MARRKVPRGPDGLPLPKLLVTYRCKVCAVKFKATIYDGDPDPACPNLECGEVQTAIGLDVAGGRAPSVGGSLGTRAFDRATDIVMQDQHLTNLSDAKYEGDSMAPKLGHAQQKIADSMFDPKARAEVFGGMRGGGSLLNRIAGQGAGAASSLIQPSRHYRDPIAPIHAARSAPPVNIIHRG